LKRVYDPRFQGGDAYRETLPDTQNASAGAIKGAPVAVQQVGVAAFRMPIQVARPDGSLHATEGRLRGTVQLDAGVRGINMSRIIRAVYPYHNQPLTLDMLETAVRAMLASVACRAGRLRLDFSYPILQESLRSGMVGYQFYDAAYEVVIDSGGTVHRRIHFDFIYSSACPGSADLADHAETTRGIYSIPHSQRSRARLELELSGGASLTLEAIRELCRRALETEVQVMVRRDDEQAFAEMNGAYTKFVEDAARLLFGVLDDEAALADFRVECSHMESLHAHDAIAVIVKGVSGGMSGA